MTGTKKIVIIDDDAFSNFICNVVVRHICKPRVPDISDFTVSAEGLAYVANRMLTQQQPLVLFLDMDMPGLSGWDVLDVLSRLPDRLKAMLTVYLHTTYLSPLNEQRAAQHPLVTGTLIKPITNRIEWLRKELLSDEVATGEKASRV